jgi:hypothetical protein
LELEYGETGGLAFSSVKDVYKPTRTSTTKVVDAPEDLVGWFQQHPYVQIDKPEPIIVGGVKGMEFDVAAAGTCQGTTIVHAGRTASISLGKLPVI